MLPFVTEEVKATALENKYFSTQTLNFIEKHIPWASHHNNRLLFERKTVYLCYKQNILEMFSSLLNEFANSDKYITLSFNDFLVDLVDG